MSIDAKRIDYSTDPNDPAFDQGDAAKRWKGMADLVAFNTQRLAKLSGNKIVSAQMQLEGGGHIRCQIVHGITRVKVYQPVRNIPAVEKEKRNLEIIKGVIVLAVSDTIKYWIPYEIVQNDYTLGEEIETEGPGDFEFYTQHIEAMSNFDPAYTREVCPYILFGPINYVTAVAGKWDDWHKQSGTYIGAPKMFKESDDIFRPYGRKWSYHQGSIVHWHASMSAVTSTVNHLLLSRYIDNMRRNYWPYDMWVSFGEGQQPKFFSQVPPVEPIDESGGEAHLILPSSILSCYGKRPYSITSDEEYFCYGESIVPGGNATITLSGDGAANQEILPVMFFWPWIPYMDEIGHFHLLSFNKTTSEMYSYELNPLYLWDLKYYEISGDIKKYNVLTDTASFNNSTFTETYEYPIETPNPNPSWNAEGIETRVSTTSPYSSSGTKHTPIGSLGGKKGCYLKTEWTTAGSGPVVNYNGTLLTTGNFPFTQYQSSGWMMGVVVEYAAYGANLINESADTQTWTESASNNVSLTQKLMMGDDVVAIGNSTMNYAMSRSGEGSFSGRFGIKVDPKVPDPCSLLGTISYTLATMPINTTQTLGITDAQTCLNYTWSLAGGGSLSNYTGVSTTYIAPVSNSGCTDNATITLCATSKEGYESISGTCDTLGIAVYNPATAWSQAGWITSCVCGRSSGYELVYIAGRILYCNGIVGITAYACSSEWSALWGDIPGWPGRCAAHCAEQEAVKTCEDSTRTSELLRNGCCPEQLM